MSAFCFVFALIATCVDAPDQSGPYIIVQPWYASDRPSLGYVQRCTAAWHNAWGFAGSCATTSLDDGAP